MRACQHARPPYAQSCRCTGSRVNAWFANWLTLIRPGDTDHDIHVLGSYLTGLILHQLAVPDLGSDPVGKITALLESLVKAAGTPVRDSAHHDGTEPARSTTS